MIRICLTGISQDSAFANVGSDRRFPTYPVQSLPSNPGCGHILEDESSWGHITLYYLVGLTALKSVIGMNSIVSSLTSEKAVVYHFFR